MPIYSPDLLPKLQANDPALTELICSQFKGIHLAPQEVEQIAEALQNNTTIETINFLGNSINTNAAHLLARFFMQNPRLKHVYLGTCDLRSNVSIILQSLVTHSSVEMLDLNTNGLDDADAVHIVLLLEKNTVLEELEVGNNGFTIVAYQKMLDALQDNCELAAGLTFSAMPDQYFDNPEKTIIEDIQAFCEAKKNSNSCTM